MRSRSVTATASAMVVFLLVVNQPAFAQDQVADGQWYHQFLSTAQAHQAVQGESITVAVIDSGVDASHPDLVGSVLPGTDLTHEGPGDGRRDTDGHGTKMASLIAAHGRVRGVAPEAKILAVRAGTGSGTSTSNVALGIRWAVAQKAKVISIATGNDVDDQLTRQEIQAALAADTVVVASAGNKPPDSSVLFPAAYPGVVAVAAVGRNGERAPVSATGPQIVIAAPGVDISGAHPGGKYSIGTGTSDATAIVAGAVALIRARYPQLKAADVVRRLTATATDKGSPGRDPEYGFGVINLVAALTADVPVATDGPSALSKGPGPGGGGSSTPDGPQWLLYVVFGAAGVALVVAVIAFVLFARGRRRG